MEKDQVILDLKIGVFADKGLSLQIKHCWHFSTDGHFVDQMFYDETDFIDGMNRIYVVLQRFDVLILAFCLMDNHIHFVLYGIFEECNSFMHEYIRRTSMAISFRHRDHKKLAGVPIDYQPIKTDVYLKQCICYDICNPVVAGMPYLPFTYPWSSGSLYFFSSNDLSVSSSHSYYGNANDNIILPNHSYISSVLPMNSRFHSVEKRNETSEHSTRELRVLMKTKSKLPSGASMNGIMIAPTEYVCVDLVERLFRTPKALWYFMTKTREKDIEEHQIIASRLSLPDKEIAQHKREICKDMYGTDSIRSLSIEQRLQLAKALKFKYGCSVKQLARQCGLVYAEIKDLL